MMQTHDMTSTFAAGREFIRREARVLEQRLFATTFEDASPAGVIAALHAYRNADGGFGHGLEPDKLCPASLAIDVETALLTMTAAGTVDHAMVEGACAFLATISRDGAVPLAAPVIETYPRAEHWSDWTYQPDVNPTAGLVGLLYALDVDHPWRKEATAYCWSALERGLPGDAHALGEALVFLAHVDDPDRAAPIADRVAEHMRGDVSHLRLDPADPDYGVSPLHYAPRPSSRWRALFSDEVIAGHLDRLEADQQSDGGWALTWEPPSRAATLAYRGIVTLWALKVLTAYGRITPPR
jgi:hypothetical protein